MSTLLLFAQAREAAGTNRLMLSGATVQDLLDQASLAQPRTCAGDSALQDLGQRRTGGCL